VLACGDELMVEDIRRSLMVPRRANSVDVDRRGNRELVDVSR
jgi:hypothetical protein